MVKTLLKNAPTNLFLNFLNWLNKDSTKLLEKEKQKFEKILEQKEADERCMFFGNWEKGTVTKEDVKELHKEFGERADRKSDKRTAIAQVLQWVTFILTSALLGTILSVDVEPRMKIGLVIFGVMFGLVITKIQKNKIITIRLDAFRYRLQQLHLERFYCGEPFLPMKITVAKSLRGELTTDEEDRDIIYEKYSLTNLELITVFLVQIMYLILLVLSFFLTWN